MISKIRNVSSLSKLNKIYTKNINLRCGRDTCHCMNMKFTNKYEKKFYNNCYSKWYNHSMINMLELY